MELKILDHHDHYKFLGEFQNTQHLDEKTIEEAAEEYGSFGHYQFNAGSKLRKPVCCLHYSITCGELIG